MSATAKPQAIPSPEEIDRFVGYAYNGDCDRFIGQMLDTYGDAIIDQVGYPRRTALIAAIMEGHQDTVELLLRRGADVNARAIAGHGDWTPLIYAVMFQQPEILKLLIARGARLDDVCDLGNTALDYARREGGEIVDLLQQPMADKFVSAVRFGRGENIAMIKKMLDQDPDLAKAVDSEGDTALLRAGMHGFKDIVALLLKHGAEVNAQNRNGDTAVMWAAGNGHEETTDLLLEHGADTHLQNNKNQDLMARLEERYPSMIPFIEAWPERHKENMRLKHASFSKGLQTGLTVGPSPLKNKKRAPVL